MFNKLTATWLALLAIFSASAASGQTAAPSTGQAASPKECRPNRRDCAS